MDNKDISKLENLNKRYSSVNMTGFKIVNKSTTEDTLIRHIETDLEILNSSDVQIKRVYRVILEGDVIDICSNDNGTPVSYFFTSDAQFTPQDVKNSIRDLCIKHKVFFENFNRCEVKQ